MLEGAIYKHQSILIYKNTNLALLFLAKQFVFTLLKPITLDSYFKNNYKKKKTENSADNCCMETAYEDFSIKKR